MVQERESTIQKVKICLSKDELSVSSIKVTFQLEGRTITKIFGGMKEDSVASGQIRALMSELKVRNVKALVGKKINLVLLSKKSKIIAFHNPEKEYYISIFSKDGWVCCCEFPKKIMQEEIKWWNEKLQKTPKNEP